MGVTKRHRIVSRASASRISGHKGRAIDYKYYDNNEFLNVHFLKHIKIETAIYYLVTVLKFDNVISYDPKCYKIIKTTVPIQFLEVFFRIEPKLSIVLFYIHNYDQPMS